MLYYDRINVSGTIDINNTSESKECIICHYWYFFDKGFKFQLHVYNGCHDLLTMSMNLINTTALNIHSVDCCCIISGISKNKLINLIKNVDLTEKSKTL